MTIENTATMLEPTTEVLETTSLEQMPELPQERPQPTNVPFHLLIASSHAKLQTLAKHFDLSDLRLLTDIERKGHLPPAGFKRGQALDGLLGKVEHTISIGVVIDEVWVQALLDNNPMAKSVWRSIESKLFGHRTNSQRRLVIVAADKKIESMREAEAKGEVLSVISGQPLPSNWIEARPAKVEKKAATKPQVAKKQVPKEQAVQKPQGKPQKAAKPTGEKSVPVRKDVPSKAPQRVLPGRSRHGQTNPLHQDIYLMCKGHYGPVGSIELLDPKVQKVMQHHTGAGLVSSEDAVRVLYETLLSHSSRSYWGTANLLRDLVTAGGRGPTEVMMALSSWIALIPAQDHTGQPIPQPKPNPALQ